MRRAGARPLTRETGGASLDGARNAFTHRPNSREVTP